MKTARTKVQAAEIYPANYWLSLFNPPDTSTDWANTFKGGCMLCHQIGNKATRSLDTGTTRQAYDAGTKEARTMYQTSLGLGRDKLLDALADWSQRIAKGETPPSPPRPSGKERDLVITQWNWGDQFTYAHDEVATDRNNPQSNANGPVWGVDLGNDYLLRTDPITNTSTKIKIPTVGGFSTPWCDQSAGPGLPASGFASLGCPATEAGGVTDHPGVYDNPANPHNPMIDSKGRVWVTTQIRREWPQDIPAFCKDSPGIAGHSHHRQLGYYDPQTGKWQLIDTCFGTHHLQFDKSGKLWVSGDSYVFGWFDPSKYDPAHPETAQTAQGWSEMKIDTNGDGVADTAIPGFNYGIIPNDKDGSVWSGQLNGTGQGAIVRYDPATDKFEKYIPKPGAGYPRGVDVDSKGIIWVGMGSGHLASFDRSKCTHTWGDGTQCPEGWTYYRPGPLVPHPRWRGQRRLPLLRVGGQVQHLRDGQGHADPDRYGVRLPSGVQPEDEEVHHRPDPLPAELLHAGARRADRQPQDRLEGPRSLVRPRHRPDHPHREAAGLRRARPDAADAARQVAPHPHPRPPSPEAGVGAPFVTPHHEEAHPR